MGYPFPEFTNFDFDKTAQKLSWTNTGNLSSPIFPIEGMVTRKLKDQKNKEVGIELSRPGLIFESFSISYILCASFTTTNPTHT